MIAMAATAFGVILGLMMNNLDLGHGALLLAFVAILFVFGTSAVHKDTVRIVNHVRNLEKQINGLVVTPAPLLTWETSQGLLTIGILKRWFTRA